MMCKEKSKKWRCAKALYIVPVAAIAALTFTTVETANATESESLLKGSEFVADNERKVVENCTMYYDCTVAPQFPGGDTAYRQWSNGFNEPDTTKAAGVLDADISDLNVSVIRKDDASSSPSVIRGEAIVLVNDVPYDGDVSSIEPISIESISFVKAEQLSAELQALCKERGQEGVMSVKLKTPVALPLESDGKIIGETIVEEYPVEYVVDSAVVDSADNAEKIYQLCEKVPEFPGGTYAMMQWLGNNIRYPKAARDINGHGRVFVNFVVRADGSISDAQVTRCDFSSDYSEVSLAEKQAKNIELYKSMIKQKEAECKEFEQHIVASENNLAAIENDTPENILARYHNEFEETRKFLEKEKARVAQMKPEDGPKGSGRYIEEIEKQLATLEKLSASDLINHSRENLENSRKHLEEKKADVVKLKRELAQKEEALANSKNELDKVVVTAYKNNNGEASSTDEAMALRANAEKALKVEAVRVVTAMPKWNPGMQGGKAVNVRYTLPVLFRLR